MRWSPCPMDRSDYHLSKHTFPNELEFSDTPTQLPGFKVKFSTYLAGVTDEFDTVTFSSIEGISFDWSYEQTWAGYNLLECTTNTPRCVSIQNIDPTLGGGGVVEFLGYLNPENFDEERISRLIKAGVTPVSIVKGASPQNLLEVKLQELYVGILGRAGDRPGLDYWLDGISSTPFTLENTRAAFTDPAQSEYTEIYGGLDFTQLVTAIYENFLERLPDGPGLLYWVEQLTLGNVNADQMINAIISAVQDPNATAEETAKDLATLENKIAAAIYFTEQTKDYPFDAAYREMARAVVADVTDDPETLTQAKVMIDEYVGN